MKKRFLTYNIFPTVPALGIKRNKARQRLKVCINPNTLTDSAVLDVEAPNPMCVAAMRGTERATAINIFCSSYLKYDLRNNATDWIILNALW